MSNFLADLILPSPRARVHLTPLGRVVLYSVPASVGSVLLLFVAITAIAAVTGRQAVLPIYVPAAIGLCVAASFVASRVVRRRAERAAARAARATGAAAAPAPWINSGTLLRAIGGWSVVGMLDMVTAVFLLVIISDSHGKLGTVGTALVDAIGGLLSAFVWIGALHLWERVRAWSEGRPAHEPRGVWPIAALGAVWTIAMLVIAARG
jgi:hypothetical protein